MKSAKTGDAVENHSWQTRFLAEISLGTDKNERPIFAAQNSSYNND